MTKTRPVFIWLLVIAVLHSVTGCSKSGRDRYGLSGTVTYAGKPIPIGDMIFKPDSSRGNSGPGSSADVSNGHYQVPSQYGVVGGPYVVTISGFDRKPVTIGEELRPSGSPLFQEYQVSIELPKAEVVKDFEIAALEKN